MYRRIILVLLVIGSLIAGGCVRLDVQRTQETADMRLRPAAQILAGVSSGDIVTEAEITVSRQPMHTQLIREVAAQARQAVVSVYAQTRTPYRVHLLPLPLPGTGIPVRVPGVGLGSGFFIHPSGYLMTNNHVIQRADEVKVLLQDGTDFEVTVVARDPVYDLALLKVVTAEKAFPVLPMGDSAAIDSGDIVIAVGNPLGLGHTVTSGIISHAGRHLSGVAEEEAREINFIQTDAAINPGSSGGPLITLTGAWVGVNTAGAQASQGIGFAVPSNQVREFLDNIRAGNGLPEEPSAH
jgi:S1-C subfamily serine protease